MNTAMPVLAGIVSTVIFVSSTFPMLLKALRTRDLGSYSLGHLALTNVGNAVHSVYVFSLPPGPLWALHSFHLSSTVFMLVWYLRFELLQQRRAGSAPGEGGLLEVVHAGRVAFESEAAELQQDGSRRRVDAVGVAQWDLHHRAVALGDVQEPRGVRAQQLVQSHPVGREDLVR